MFKRMVEYLKKRRYFKKGKLFLESGLYCLDGSDFYKCNRENKSHGLLNCFRIRKQKNSDFKKYNSGKYALGKYKAKFILDDLIVFILYNKRRFKDTKNSYQKYIDKIFFNVAKYEFLESKLIISSPIIKGIQYFDDYHFELFAKEIVNQYTNSNIYSTISINEINNVPLFVQHGDCKNSNIIWQNDNPILIDLEAMGPYPIFYDLFYYLFITYKEKSIGKFEMMRKLINITIDKLNIETPIDPLDFFLSCYLIYLSKYISKKYSNYVIKFYLSWICYSDYSFLPFLKSKIEDAKKEISRIGYCI